MITDWEQLNGKTIEATYHSHGGVVFLLGDEFVVIAAEPGYNDEAYLVLAELDDEDALFGAVQAGAPRAQQLLDEAKRRRDEGRENQERHRLAYLLEKYEVLPARDFPEGCKLAQLMKELFSSNFEGDLHSKLAELIFGEDFTPTQRTKIKERVFRILYGGTVNGPK